MGNGPGAPGYANYNVIKEKYILHEICNLNEFLTQLVTLFIKHYFINVLVFYSIIKLFFSSFFFLDTNFYSELGAIVSL